MCVNSDRNTDRSRKTEIGQLDSTLLVDEQILGFQISVQHTTLVTETDGFGDLEQITLKTDTFLTIRPDMIHTIYVSFQL